MEGQEKLASVQVCNHNLSKLISDKIFAQCKDMYQATEQNLYKDNVVFSECMEKPYATEEICKNSWKAHIWGTCKDLNQFRLKGNMNIPLNQYIDKEELKKYKDGFYLGVKADGPLFAIFDCSKHIGYNQRNIVNNITHVTYDNVDILCIKTNTEEQLVRRLEEQRGEIYFLNGPSYNCTKLLGGYGQEPVYLSWSKSILENKVNDAYFNKTEGQTNEETDGPVNNIPKVKEVCGKIDVKELETIQGLSIASSVTSGIGAVGGVAGAITSGLSINKKESKGLDIASTITSAIGGATSTAGAVTSGIAAAKLKEIIDNIKKCKEEVSKLQ